ncbi:Crp/Fnr family transcriptional regulator [Parasphingorhabdus sp.]|uniref:Crp/Fnr family transcriptional regulator n=1 Tax=Parasphingorhabdus sp. TaxID=2709688 RepID=UPI003A8D55E7
MQIATQITAKGAFPHQPRSTAAAGRTLFFEGDECQHVYELCSGIVRGVTLSENGERQVTAFFFANDQIGLPITPNYRYSAEAVTNVTYVRRPCNDWRLALIESCRTDGGMLRSIGAEQDPIYRRGMLLGRQGAMPRVAAFLCNIIDRLPGDRNSFDLPMPQLDIADYLALSPETVCRSLKRLREHRIIEMPTHDLLVVRDRDALERTAHQ